MKRFDKIWSLDSLRLFQRLGLRLSITQQKSISPGIEKMAGHMTRLTKISYLRTSTMTIQFFSTSKQSKRSLFWGLLTFTCCCYVFRSRLSNEGAFFSVSTASVSQKNKHLRLITLIRKHNSNNKWMSKCLFGVLSKYIVKLHW